MPRYISLLRGVNVGGHRKVPMADLRGVYESIDCEDVASLLQSGNVVFRSNERSTAKLRKRIEEAIEEHFGFAVPVLLRTRSEWQRLVDENPFAEQAAAEPSKLLVLFLPEAPKAAARAALDAAHQGLEQMAFGRRELYAWYPDGLARSKFDNALVDRHLQTTATGRNWNTVLKLQALADD